MSYEEEYLESLRMKYEPQYKKYMELKKKKKFPNCNTKLSEFYKILEEEYKAVEISKYSNDLTEENDDDGHYDLKDVRRCYQILDSEILEEVYTEKEKRDMIECEEEWGIYLYLGSVSGEYLEYWTMMGGGKKVSALLYIFGVDYGEDSLDNESFFYYLGALERTGYLD